MTVYLHLRSGSSGPAFTGENEGDTLLWSVAQGKFYVGPGGGGGGGVTSFDGRTGAVVPESGDYDTDQIANVSTVAGATLSDALDNLDAEIGALAAGPEQDEGDAGAAFALDYSTGPKMRLVNVDQNTTITVTPPALEGYVDLRLTYGGAFTVAFVLEGGAPIRWSTPFVPTTSAEWDLVTWRWAGGVMSAAYSPGGYNA